MKVMRLTCTTTMINFEWRGGAVVVPKTAELPIIGNYLTGPFQAPKIQNT